MGSGDVFTGLNWPGLEVDDSRSSSAEVRNEWSSTSSPNIYLHGVERENFTFLLLWFCEMWRRVVLYRSCREPAAPIVIIRAYPCICREGVRITTLNLRITEIRNPHENLMSHMRFLFFLEDEINLLCALLYNPVLNCMSYSGLLRSLTAQGRSNLFILPPALPNECPKYKFIRNRSDHFQGHEGVR